MCSIYFHASGSRRSRLASHSGGPWRPSSAHATRPAARYMFSINMLFIHMGQEAPEHGMKPTCNPLRPPPLKWVTVVKMRWKRQTRRCEQNESEMRKLWFGRRVENQSPCFLSCLLRHGFAALAVKTSVSPVVSLLQWESVWKSDKTNVSLVARFQPWDSLCSRSESFKQLSSLWLHLGPRSRFWL